MADGFRRYRIVAKTRESSVITSFKLVAADGGPMPAFVPGQFLTVRVPDRAGGADLLRHYSLSGDPARRDVYRISVKRESAPAGRADVSPGRVSTLLHEVFAAGDELAARGPEGAFVLDRESERPVLLLAGGVGLTPLLAMAHDLAREGRRATWFIHACEGRDAQAHGAELRALAAATPSLRLHVLYRTAQAGDRMGIDHDGTGLVTRDVLQGLLPLDDYDVYLCGPTPFMQAVYGILIGLGVREERIRYEFFGQATVLSARKADVVPASQPASPVGEGIVVTFAASGRSAAWTGGQETLLDFAEAQGLSPAFSCRAGICSTCACRLVSGTVDYVTEPLDTPAPGVVLLCCARPREAVVLDL